MRQYLKWVMDLAMQEYTEFQAAGIAKASEKQDPTQTSGRGHPKDKESEKGPRGREEGGLACLC